MGMTYVRNIVLMGSMPGLAARPKSEIFTKSLLDSSIFLKYSKHFITYILGTSDFDKIS
jgi:hypothetical protein